MKGVDPYLVARLGEPTTAGGLEVRFDCPQPSCVARRHQKGSDKKLYVNFSKEVFHCVRCGWGGPIESLYKSFGMTRETTIQAPINLREAIGYLDPELSLRKPPEEGTEGVYLPPTTEAWGTSLAYSWLWGRLSTVPQQEVVDLVRGGLIRLGAGRYWDRVFFCDVYRGTVRYWTARTYVDGMSPKYLNPYNVPRREVLFNQEQVESKGYEEVIICEGTISAICAGANAVGTYGRCVTDAQIRILLSLPARRFIIASESDRDAKMNTMALAEALFRGNRDVSIMDLPDKKDPADLGRTAVQSLVRQACPFNWENKVRRRLAYA